MSYMRRGNVFVVFDDTNDRMLQVIRDIDADPFYAAWRPQTRDIDGVQVAYPSWEAAYNGWMGQFLRLKEFKMQRWIELAVVDLKAKIAADTSIQSTTRNILNVFINAQSVSPGQMSTAAVSFGPRYAALMAND